MKFNAKYTGFLCLFLWTLTAAQAQDSLQMITLEKVLQLGGANNLTIQHHQQKQVVAAANLKKAREWWLPDIYAGSTINQLWGSAMNGNGLFFTDVNAQNFWAGIGVGGRWNIAEGIFRTKSKNLQAQVYQHLTAAQRNKVLLESIEAYYDFLSAQLYFTAYEQLLDQNDRIIQQLAVQVDAGLRYQSELLIAKSNRSHLRVERLNAKIEQGKKAAILIGLLNLPAQTQLICADSLLAPVELVADIETQIIDAAVYKNRPEFSAAALQLQSMEMQYKISTTARWLPELKFNMYGSMFGDVFSPLYPTSGLNFSLIWKLPLGNLSYKGDAAQYQASVDLQRIEVDMLKSSIHVEYAAAKSTLKIASMQMKIAKEGRTLAETALIQSMQRQQLGTVLPFEILQVQEVYIKARLHYLKAVTGYNKAMYALYVALGNEL